jgi:cyclic pyranopterin phosphate synthase
MIHSRALMAGNHRFAEAWRQAEQDKGTTHRTADPDPRCFNSPRALATSQHPWATVLTCSDSRVSPSWVFDTTPGELFVIRNAGNSAFDEAMASVEYGVSVLKTPLLMVMGHSGCGAVTAAMDANPLTPFPGPADPTHPGEHQRQQRSRGSREAQRPRQRLHVDSTQRRSGRCQSQRCAETGGGLFPTQQRCCHLDRMTQNLSHLNQQGEVHMVDVGDRPATNREAHARGAIRMEASTLSMIQRGETPKGDLLAVARVAAIQAAKHTWELIPLCHPLPLSGMDVTIDADASLPGLVVHCRCRTTGQTGVEMEAMTAVSVGLLTLYDMLKAVDPAMTIEAIQLEFKEGGRNGVWKR